MKQAKALMMRYMPMMVTCEEANRFIDDYLADELAAKQRIIFNWHIRLCTGCKDYLERYRRSIDLCRENFYDDGQDSDEVPDQILQGIIAAKRAEQD